MTQKHDITFGDLVSVDGYDDRPFFVDGWTIESHYTPDAEWSEVWFDITCAHTGEYMMAELADIKRICGAEAADDYLQSIVTQINKKTGENSWEVTLSFGSINRKKEPSKNDLYIAQKKKEAEIDGLLDELNDYSALADAFGDDEYSEKVEQLKIRLKQAVEKSI